MHPWVVLKFGGTSVSSRARWDTIARVVRARQEEGVRPVVVCSAAGGISRLLDRVADRAPAGEAQEALDEIRARHVALADELGLNGEALLGPYLEGLERMTLGASLTGEVSPRLRARLLATGEFMSTTLGAAFLDAQAIPTQWHDARTLLRTAVDPAAPEGPRPARHYLAAHADYAPDPELADRLAGDAVPLTQGFLASDARGDTVLLGWGGSDTSAAYLAAKLEAARLEIWTDVPGLFTANPRVIPQARLLRALGYDEAQELATMGAKVLHPRCLDPVRAYGIPLHIHSTEDPDLPGTVISDDARGEEPQVKAISTKGGVTLVSMDALGMWQEVGFLADVFAVFKRHGLSVDLIATAETNVTVSLDDGANVLDPARVAALLDDLRPFCRAHVIGPCAAVTLVGRHIRSLLHEIAPALAVFEEQPVHLVSQAANDLNLTFVVDEEQAPRLLRTLHADLFGDRLPDRTLGPAWRELTEGTPAGDGAAAPAWWHARRDDLLRVAAASAPCYVYDAATLDARVEAVRSVEAVDRVFYAMKANPHPGILRRFHEAGIGFECVSPGEVERVRALFPDVDPDRILFTPNFAPREDYAFAYGVGAHVTLDNLYPLEAWPDLFAGRDLLLRVDPGQGHGHHKHVRTAGAQSKFGVWPSELERLKALADAAGARIVGLHAHVGSGIRTAGTWAQTAVFLASLTDRFPDVRRLNLGGGFGVVERPGTSPLDVPAVGASLTAFRAAHPEMELWVEPGRYLVAEAGVLLARVTQTKTKGEVQYVGVETGMNSLVRPALYGAYHAVANLTRLDAPLELTAEVVGPICETGDVLGHGRRLPETREGDVLLFATAGAYGRAMASEYNLRPPAGEVMLEA